jgi:anti-sigma regulatory factor (Ser/Thr protein kinase)
MLKGNNKITITSSTKNLAKVREFVEEKAKQLGFQPTDINQIILSVDEACTNIIKYTHNYDEAQHIEIELANSNRQLKITIKYQGNSFNPNHLPEPDMHEYFEKFKVGGLGIPMMRKFMSKIEYVHKNPDHNSLTLIKIIP